MKLSKERLAANACALAWRVINASPLLKKGEKSLSKLWEKSSLLTHPFTQIKQGFVFIHVPKTAGTSVREALGIKATEGMEAHSRARDVLPFIRLVAPELISVAFTRNPYTRFLSLYNFARMDESFYFSSTERGDAPCGRHPDYDTLSNKSLEECAELLIQGKIGDPSVRTHIWHPQVEWLTDRNGKMTIDFIGRVESLDADLQRLKELHGIASQPVPMINKSSQSGAPPKFSRRAITLVQLYYKRDFEMLGYDEEPSESLRLIEDGSPAAEARHES